MHLWLIAAVSLVASSIPSAATIYREEGLSERFAAAVAAVMIGVLMLMMLLVRPLPPTQLEITFTLLMLGFPLVLILASFAKRWLL